MNTTPPFLPSPTPSTFSGWLRTLYARLAGVPEQCSGLPDKAWRRWCQLTPHPPVRGSLYNWIAGRQHTAPDRLMELVALTGMEAYTDEIQLAWAKSHFNLPADSDGRTTPS